VNMTGIALQTQEVAPMGFKRWPPPCGVALCSMWHFVLREWILEVAPVDSRGGPHRVVWHFVPRGT